MHMFYAVLAFVMTVFNVSRGLNPVNVMNLVMAALWLAIGIVFTAKHLKDRKKEQKKRENHRKED